MRRLVPPLAWLALVILVMAVPGAARAERDFAPRFTANTQGDVAIAANGILSCIGSDPVCPAARDGTASPVSANNNNARVMSYVDADGDATTFNSSAAGLVLPPGARVLFAGLYYGGRLAAGSGGAAAPDPAARGSVLLRGPDDAGYRAVTAAQVDEAGQTYQGFADVTEVVRQQGAGGYAVANVQAGTGRSDGQLAGWALVVAYASASEPSRNLAVFDGLKNVASSSGGVVIPLSGFLTPPSGPVRATVGIVAYEGDLATTGDGARINGGALSDAANPASNLFNATIARDGASVLLRSPNYRNQLGFDADLFPTAGVLTNGQTSTEVRLTTSGDAYQPGVVTIATELFAPRIVATKSVDRATAERGDQLTYTVELRNDGQDAATGVVVTDPLPAQVEPVPGSIEVVSGPNAGVKTDAAGDDQAEYDAATRRVVVRLGAGAGAAAGGTLGVGAATTVRFRVRVGSAPVRPGTEVRNAARVEFAAATTGAADALETAPALTVLRAPDIGIRKVHQGTYVPGVATNVFIAVGNEGDAPSAGPVTVRDTLPVGLTIAAPPFGDGWTCAGAVGGRDVECVFTIPIPAQLSPPAIVVPVVVAAGADPASLVNTATASSPDDANPDNNTAVDAAPTSGAEIDLAVTKSVDDENPYGPGVPIAYRIVVRNTGPEPAALTELTDTLPDGMDLVSAVPSQGTCTGLVCRLGQVDPGGTVTVEVTTRLSGSAARYPGDARLVNTASVTAVGRDRDPSDNTATAAIDTFPIADPRITKSFAPDRPLAGGRVTYTLRITNARQTADVVAFDVLPPELLNPQAEISGPTGLCEVDLTGEISGIPLPGVFCQIPQLAAGEERVVTVTGTLDPASAGRTVSNIAVTSTDALQVVPDEIADNRAVQFFIVGSVDVALAKERLGDPGPLAVGGTTTFRLTAQSLGTVEATEVMIADVLPEGLAVASAPPECAVAGREVRCAVGTIFPGESTSVDVVVRGEAVGAERTLTNAATVTRAEPDVAPGNDSASATVTLGPYAGLSVTKEAGGPTVRAGESVPFVVTVQNDGPSAATGVTAADVLPPDLVLRSATPSQGSCAGLACALGAIPSGASARVTFLVEAPAGVAGRRVNGVEVSGVEPGTTTRAEAAVEILAPPAPQVAPDPAPADPVVDVAVTVAAPRRVVEGARAAWTVTVRNVGGTTAREVDLATTPSASADLVGSVEAQRGCSLSTRRLSCGLGDLPPGSVRTLAVPVAPRRSGAVTLSAAVTPQGTDARPVDNTDAATVRARPGPTRVSVAKRVTTSRAAGGAGAGDALFAVTVRTTGRLPARDVVVCDIPGPGVVIANAPGATRRDLARACWSIATLAPGEARTVTLQVVTAARPAVATRTNTATVRAANAPPVRTAVRFRVPAARPVVPAVTG